MGLHASMAAERDFQQFCMETVSWDTIEQMNLEKNGAQQRKALLLLKSKLKADFADYKREQASQDMAAAGIDSWGHHRQQARRRQDCLKVNIWDVHIS